MKLEFSRQIFEKFSNIELHENPSSDSQTAACGRADTTKLTVAFIDLFLQFCERAQKERQQVRHNDTSELLRQNSGSATQNE